jgi:hypothetical protein
MAALMVSGQFPTHTGESLNKTEFTQMLELFRNKKLPVGIYEKYAACYRYLRNFFSELWLLENAGLPDFETRIS